MAAFFQNLHRTLAAGVVLLIVIIILVGSLSGQFIRFDAGWWRFFVRWLHIMTGVMWVGLLWYLNFVQTPTVPKIEPVSTCAIAEPAPNSISAKHATVATNSRPAQTRTVVLFMSFLLRSTP